SHAWAFPSNSMACDRRFGAPPHALASTTTRSWRKVRCTSGDLIHGPRSNVDLGNLAAGEYAMRACWFFTAAAFFHTLCCIGSAHAAEAPQSIKLGSLYAAAGRYASISLTAHRGLQLWVEMKNAAGGVFVRPFNKKIPIELIDYDDQSSTSTAATLYNQLITRDKVDLLIADSGTVLTSVAVPIARNNKHLLID